MRLQQSQQWAPGARGNSGTPPPGGWLGPVVYAAPTSRGVVNVYPGGSAKPTKLLYSFSLNPGVANSLIVDRQRNLFLADSYSTWVFEYAPGTATPLKSFPTAQTPFNIALFGETLFVFEAQPSGGGANVAVYKNGSTKSSETLTDSHIVSPSGMAVDGAGNVFVGYNGANFSFGVGEFVGGKMPMKRLRDGGLYPLALAIDRAGNLLIDTFAGGSASAIYIFPPGASSPSRVIPNLPWLYQISLTADGKSFYAGPTSGRTFYMYEYPSGKLIYRFADPEAFTGFAGIAASPGVEAGVW